MKYIHGSPAPKVSKFNMGDLSTQFARKAHLVAKEHVQIRHNALESARVSANKIPAGADRLQEGMRRAFGKPTGRAARVENGQSIFIVYVPEDGVDTAKKALEVAGTKLPMKTRILVEEPVAPQIPAGA